MNIYLGSDNLLDEIEYDDDNPQFYIKKVTDEKVTGHLDDILKKNHYYDPGTFMGCSCGLYYFEGLEEPDKRLKDINLFYKYIIANSENNDLKLIVIDYDSFPDKFPEKEINTEEELKEILQFEENVIYKINI